MKKITLLIVAASLSLPFLAAAQINVAGCAAIDPQPLHSEEDAISFRNSCAAAGGVSQNGPQGSDSNGNYVQGICTRQTPQCTGQNSTGLGTTNGSPTQQGTNLGYTPLEPIPGITTGANGTLDFPHLLGNIYKIAITIGALFSVLMLTISGIRYMVSDIVTSKEKAKKRITACLYGLVLIAASYLILNTINPQLVTFNLNPGTSTITAPTPINNSTGQGTALPSSAQSGSTACATSGGIWTTPAFGGGAGYCQK